MAMGRRRNSTKPTPTRRSTRIPKPRNIKVELIRRSMRMPSVEVIPFRPLQATSDCEFSSRLRRDVADFHKYLKKNTEARNLFGTYTCLEWQEALVTYLNVVKRNNVSLNEVQCWICSHPTIFSTASVKKGARSARPTAVNVEVKVENISDIEENHWNAVNQAVQALLDEVEEGVQGCTVNQEVPMDEADLVVEACEVKQEVSMDEANLVVEACEGNQEVPMDEVDLADRTDEIIETDDEEGDVWMMAEENIEIEELNGGDQNCYHLEIVQLEKLQEPNNDDDDEWMQMDDAIAADNHRDAIAENMQIVPNGPLGPWCPLPPQQYLLQRQFHPVPPPEPPRRLLALTYPSGGNMFSPPNSTGFASRLLNNFRPGASILPMLMPPVITRSSAFQ